MNAETVTVKRRVVRSDLQTGGQYIMLWGCALFVVWTIHTGSHGLEINTLIANTLVAIGLPVAFLVIMKLVQLVSFAQMKRSKKVDFIDDIKDSNKAQELLPGEEDGKTVELEGTKGTLLLLLVLYTLTVVSSFLYASQVYFVVALVFTASLVVSGSFIFARSVISKEKKEPGELTPHPEDQALEISDQEDRDSDQTPITFHVLGAQARFSRSWAAKHLYYVSTWIPLVLAIPLIAQLFGGSFWMSVAVGVAYLFVVEMCTLYTFFNVFERFSPTGRTT